MPLDLQDVLLQKAVLPEYFVQHRLEGWLVEHHLLPNSEQLEDVFADYQRRLRTLGEGDETCVKAHVIEPLLDVLGYTRLVHAPEVVTGAGAESGGSLLETADATRQLRAWAIPVGQALDAPNLRGQAYRLSPSRRAERVLRASGERIGLITDSQLKYFMSRLMHPGLVIFIPLCRGTTQFSDLSRVCEWKNLNSLSFDLC